MDEYAHRHGRNDALCRPLHFLQGDLTLEQQWWISGKRYARTSEDWLAKMNASKKRDLAVSGRDIWKGKYGNVLYRWQIFYMDFVKLSHTRVAIRRVYVTISS